MNFVTGNLPPNITSDDSVFVVTVGEDNVYSFEVTDSDNFTVSIEGGVPQDAIFLDDGEGRYTFTWTPTGIPTQNLVFLAEDSLGAVSVHSPVIQVCACFNGGECAEQGVPSTDQLVQNLTCICNEGM